MAEARMLARIGIKDRLGRLRLDATFAAQSGVAAGVAWFVAHHVLGHERPFFAPISAVIVLSASVGQRWRRAVELVVGVALGVGVADLLIYVIGVGVVQIAAVVVLAMLVTIFLGGGPLAVSQAASSAVLVATLAPPSTGVYVDRFVDALVGGIVGLLTMALVLPYNPLTRVERAAGAALDQLAGALALTADSLRDGDQELARRALTDLRATESDHDDLKQNLVAGREIATLAPMRWRKRPALTRYLDAAVHIERATRNARVLARRSASVLADGEPVPAALPACLSTLAEAVIMLRRELARDEDPRQARELGADAVRGAAAAYVDGVGFSGSVVVAQVRSAAVDLLQATGVAEQSADQWVRKAARSVAGG